MYIIYIYTYIYIYMYTYIYITHTQDKYNTHMSVYVLFITKKTYMSKTSRVCGIIQKHILNLIQKSTLVFNLI